MGTHPIFESDFDCLTEFRMGKTPKQYRRRDGDVSPEKIDIDEELERQYSRANRAKSSEEEKQRLEKARDVRKEEREKERERERESKSSRKQRRRRSRSRSRSRDRRRRSRSRDKKSRRSRSRDRRSRSRKSDRRDRRSRSNSYEKRRKEREEKERENKQKIDEITKETGLKVPEFLSGNAAVKRNYLETQAKRKLLWGGKKVAEKPTELTDQQKLWANLQVGTDKQTNKFQKLMGASKFKDIAKDDETGKQAANALINKQSEMFNAFDNQYRASQVQTHLSRGKGFGNS